MDVFEAFRCDECKFKRDCYIEDEEECENTFVDRYGRPKYKKVIREEDFENEPEPVTN